MVRSKLSTSIFQPRMRQDLWAAAASAAWIFLTGFIARAQVPVQNARSAQNVSREEADKIMRLNYKAFAKLRESPMRPKGYRWDTDGCTPDWAPKYFTRACYLHDFGYRNYGSARKDAPHLSPTPADEDLDRQAFRRRDE
jgi:Prokaryotic phospholipase A2